MGQRRRIFAVLGGLFGAFLFYEALTTLVVYTDDAYVRSYNVSVAPEVTGRIVGVHVVDNQEVKIGDPLVSIDPVPFQLDVNEKKHAVDEARAQLAADQDAIKGAQDAVASKSSALTFAKGAQQRRVALGKGDFVSPEDVDAATDRENRAAAGVAQAQSLVAQRMSALNMHKAALAKAEAALATAEWRLSQTELVAPRPGTINNLTVRVGDTAPAYAPLVGIIDAEGWRIIANYLQSDLRLIEEGKPAWVWLDSHPWHWRRAWIEGVARGISRHQGPEKLLPYVEPTTDWIRLQRRFPVTITLVDPPPDLKLYMGADARTVIFPW
ncbi:HlyD family secretion protein [Methylocystis parvus]|uniref:HlyD family secretion protein n=1 Tax=Methylocystis parvus TaxID=134 RepID=UPI003C747515